MRVADKMNYEQVKNSMSKNRSDMANLQNQAATMKRITKPSDDPVGTTRVLAARTDRTVSEQYLKNLAIAKSFLEASEQGLADVSDGLIRVKELALSQVNDASANAKTRLTTATEVDQIYRHFINVGNRKVGDRFVFGGFKTTATPFDIGGGYKGDDGQIEIEINKGVYVPINLTGDQVFLGVGLFDAPAWAEDKAGPPKPDIELDGKSGRPIEGSEFREESHDLRGPASPNPAVTGGEKLDVRNKRLEQAPNPGESVDPRLGVRDGVNVFMVMKELETGLRTNDKHTIQNSLDSIDQAIQQIVVARSRMGARLMNLDSIDQTLRKANIEAKTLESRVEDADVYELMTDLSRTENTLKASLSTSGKLIQPSLLDFLR